MADPYYKTINFPKEGIAVGTQQLTLKFKINDTGTDSTTDAATLGLYLRDLGDISIDADTNELLLSPAVLQFDVIDSDGFLFDYFFDESWIKLEKDALVTLKISDVEEFEGYLITEEIEYNQKDRTFSLSASPRTDLLNKTELWDDDLGTALNPLGLTSGERMSLTDLITQIFRVVDETGTLTVDFFQDWLFRGDKVNELIGTSPSIDGKHFADIFVDIDTFFFDSTKKLNNLADVLKKIAFDFGCYAGLYSNKRAFFRKLFTADTSALDYIDKEQVISVKKTLANIYEYVKLNVFADYNALSTLYYSLGDYTKLTDKYFEETTYWYIGFSGSTLTHGTYWFIDGGEDYIITEICLGETVIFPPGHAIASYTNTTYADVLHWYQLDNEFAGALLAYYWKHRCTPRSSVRTTFKLIGTDFSIISKVQYKLNDYFVISQTKNFVDNTTELNCVSIYDSN